MWRWYGCLVSFQNKIYKHLSGDTLSIFSPFPRWPFSVASIEKAGGADCVLWETVGQTGFRGKEAEPPHFRCVQRRTGAGLKGGGSGVLDPSLGSATLQKRLPILACVSSPMKGRGWTRWTTRPSAAPSATGDPHVWLYTLDGTRIGAPILPCPNSVTLEKWPTFSSDWFPLLEKVDEIIYLSLETL